MQSPEHPLAQSPGTISVAQKAVLCIYCSYLMFFQNLVDSAKPLLRKAIQISQQTPYWHCRLLFQLAVCSPVIVCGLELLPCQI